MKTVRVLLAMVWVLMLSACATSVQRLAPVPDLAMPQYACQGKVHISDATSVYSTRAVLHGSRYQLQLGEALAQQVAEHFWLDARADRRAVPMINVGFAESTGIHAQSGGAQFVVALQYQIFYPDGRAINDVAVGASEKSVAAQALTQAFQASLGQLANRLANAGVCRAVQ